MKIIEVKHPLKGSLTLNEDDKTISISRENNLKNKVTIGKDKLDVVVNFGDVDDVEFKKPIKGITSGYIYIHRSSYHDSKTLDPFLFQFWSVTPEIEDMFNSIQEALAAVGVKSLTPEERSEAKQAFKEEQKAAKQEAHQEEKAKRKVESDKAKVERKERSDYIKQFPKHSKNVAADVYYDEEHDELLINRSSLLHLHTEIVKASDIRSFQMIQDGQQSEKFGLGGAAIGGVIFGPVGLLSGFLFKKKKNTISDVRVRIFTSDKFYDIRILTAEFKANSLTAKISLKQAEKIGGFIQQLIIKNEDSKVKTAETSSQTSTADELLKLKSLLDAGVLTQEEFDEQKAKVLAN